MSTTATTTISPSQLPQTYPNALHLLSLLPTNREVTDLFAGAEGGGPGKDKDDLNARAIPEVVAWLARAGYEPADLARRGVRCVHVAGTKGKGSACAFLTAALLAHGDAAGRVGTYTSPHVVSVRERILLDGRPVGREVFARAVFEVWRRLTRAAEEAAGGAGAVPPPEGGYDGPGTKPFYFRFLTLVAFHVFAQEGVRSAVVECGIGGEYDPTSAVLPAEAVTASVVTRLGVDHVAMLGGTVEEIAWHKAGVFRRGRAAFTVGLPGQEQERALAVLRARAEEKGARLRVLDGAEVERWAGVGDGARLRGGFQKYNMAVAAAAAMEHLRVLKGEDDGDDDDKGGAFFSLDDIPPSFKEAMRGATLRGRCETIREEGGGGMEWLLDGAHTADSLAEVSRLFLAARPRTDDGALRILIFNQQERDVAALLRSMLTASSDGDGAATTTTAAAAFDLAIFTRNDPAPTPAGEPARETSVQQAAREAFHELCPGAATAVADNVAEAVRFARSTCEEKGKGGYVLVTGSFNLVRPALQMLDPDCED